MCTYFFPISSGKNRLISGGLILVFGSLWKKSLSLMLSLCLLFSIFNGSATAKPKGYEVLKNNAQIVQVLVKQNGIKYIATMDKKTHEITLETEDEKYEVKLNQIKTDENGETYFEGELINSNSKTETITFDKSRKSYEKELEKAQKSKTIQSNTAFAIPLILALEAALEALLLAAAVITVGGLTYVLATKLTEHLNNNRSYDYFAAYLYYFKSEGKSKVVIGPGISKGEAQGRVLVGADVFGRTKYLAQSVFQTVTRGPEIHGPYPDYLYHYHGKLPNESGRLIETSSHSFYPGR